MPEHRPHIVGSPLPCCFPVRPCRSQGRNAVLWLWRQPDVGEELGIQPRQRPRDEEYQLVVQRVGHPVEQPAKEGARQRRDDRQQCPAGAVHSRAAPRRDRARHHCRPGGLCDGLWEHCQRPDAHQRQRQPLDRHHERRQCTEQVERPQNVRVPDAHGHLVSAALGHGPTRDKQEHEQQRRQRAEPAHQGRGGTEARQVHGQEGGDAACGHADHGGVQIQSPDVAVFLRLRRKQQGAAHAIHGIGERPSGGPESGHRANHPLAAISGNGGILAGFAGRAKAACLTPTPIRRP